MKKLLISGIFIFIVSLTTKAQNNIIICKDGSEISGKGLCTINGNNIMTYNGSYNGGSCMASMEKPISNQMQSAVMIGFLIYGQSKTYNGIFNFN